MMNPYGFVHVSEASQQQMMNMNPMMMNPMMMPQMVRGSGYGPMQFPGHSMPMMVPQMPNQLQLAHPDDQERDEELDEHIDDAVAHYPSMMWSPQPVIYPMMMMMPMSPVNQQEEQHQRMVMAPNPPDIVDEGSSSVMHNEDYRRNYHDVTPDLVRATEPTYMNQNAVHQDEQPSYANSNVLLRDHQQHFRGPEEPHTTQTLNRSENITKGPTRRVQRAQSVQPTTGEQLHGRANFQAKRFNSTVKSPRAERSQSVTRSSPLTKSISTASMASMASTVSRYPNDNEAAKDAEMHRLPTVLHIPDIKPRFE